MHYKWEEESADIKMKSVKHLINFSGNANLIRDELKQFPAVY